MSALSVKPSHKAQSMLLGPPCVYLCRQKGSEPTRTATSTYPSIHPSFSNHLFSLSIWALLFIPYRSLYPLLWHILCHCWSFIFRLVFLPAHTSCTYTNAVFFVCASVCAFLYFVLHLIWKLLPKNQISSSIIHMWTFYFTPTAAVQADAVQPFSFYQRWHLLWSACPELSCQPTWQTGADSGLLVMFGSNCLLELSYWSINSFNFSHQ